jgi:hypothetical protein
MDGAMKKIGHVKKLIGSVVYLGLAMMLFPQTSFGQLVWSSLKDSGYISREYHPRWFQEYENFGSYDLRKNPPYFKDSYQVGLNKTNDRLLMSRVTYDPFGNFLLPGGNVYNMTWDRSNIGTTSSPFGVVGTYANDVFNNLMISSDEFSNWQTKLLIGSSIRTFFTPSTLKMNNFTGIRWDASTRKNNVTLLCQPGNLTMLGAHWQSILGDKLKVGGTFINRQRGTLAYSNNDIANGQTNGIRDTPRYIYLVVTDASPADFDNGARVYQVRTIIDGKDLTDQIQMRVMKIPNILDSKRFYSGNFQKEYVFPASGDYYPKTAQSYITSGWFLSAIAGNTITYSNLFSKTDAAKIYGLINLPDPNNPTDPSGRLFAADTSQGFQEATGNDVVFYEIYIPPQARDVQFKVLASNDYNIDLVAAYYTSAQTGEVGFDVQPFDPAYLDKWAVQYDSRNVATAKGNVKDNSNMQWVSFAYDRWTGWNVYGIDAQFVWRGLRINGEINQYNASFAYPTNEHLSGGAQHQTSARAWFVNLEKDFGKWGFGGETFNYPRDYMRYNPLIDQWLGYPGMDVDWDMTVDNYWAGAPFLTYYYDNVTFGDDFDHNGVIDQRENFTMPYDADSKGNHLFVKLKPRELTLFTLGRYDIQSQIKNGRNLTDYVKMEHFSNYSNFLEYSWQNRIERVLRDDFSSYYIPSDYAKNTSFVHTKLYTSSVNVINDFLWTFSKSYNPIIDIDTLLEHQQVLTPVKPSRISWSFSSTHKADYTLRVADARVIPDLYIGGYRILKEKRIKELKFQPMFKILNSFSTAYSLKQNSFYVRQSYNVYPIMRFDYRVAPNTLFRVGFQGFPGFQEYNRVVNENKYDDYSILNEYNQWRMVLAFENRTLYQGFNLLVTAGVRKNKQTWLEARGRLQPGQTEYFISVQSEGVR